MKKRKRIFLTAAALTLAFSAAASGAVGSDDDPLISLSYITNVVMPYIDRAVSSSGGEFTVVEVPAGKSITAGAGAELILRSGDGVISLYSGASGGFADVTSGRDTLSGEKAEVNHHLICPRSDGRSIKANSKLYVMVKGAYEIG